MAGRLGAARRSALTALSRSGDNTQLALQNQDTK